MDENQALHQARAALQHGDNKTAQALLSPLISSQPQHEAAWLVMADAVDDPGRQQDCLERVLSINPDNLIAQRRLEQLQAPDDPADSPEPTIVEMDMQLQLENRLRQIEFEQNLPLGLLGGLVGMLIAAGLWAAITVITEYQIGYMAIGVGFLVGMGVRYLGKGLNQSFGLCGAGLSLTGCLLGNLLVVLILVSRDLGVPFMELVELLDVSIVIDIYKETFEVIDLLFYGLAIYTGYRVSFRELNNEDWLKD